MTRLLDAATVDRYLTPELAIEAMERCFRLEAAGEAGPVSRTDLKHGEGWMRVLPAVFEGLGVFGHKVISFNRGVGVRYVVSMFDIESGDLRAIVDAEAITGFRTGATAAVAASRLCPEGVETAAVIGTGSVARHQLPAIHQVRPATTIRVFSRNPQNRAEFIARLRPVIDAQFVDVGSVDEALDGADLVSLATKSPDPVFAARHLRPGMHVSSVGSARPSLSELEPDTFARFDRVVCDSVELVFGESGDAIAAVDAGLYDAAEAEDLASIVGEPGPGAPGAATLFKSTGTGLQDLALALMVLEAAEADDAGFRVDQLLATKRFGPTGRT